MRKAGDQVRITAQLVDVTSQAHLWSDDYDRELADIFAVQADIAQQVAEALQITLLADERTQIERQGTASVEAHNSVPERLVFLQSGWNCSRQEQNILRAGDRAGPRLRDGLRSPGGRVLEDAI